MYFDRIHSHSSALTALPTQHWVFFFLSSLSPVCIALPLLEGGVCSGMWSIRGHIIKGNRLPSPRCCEMLIAPQLALPTSLLPCWILSSLSFSKSHEFICATALLGTHIFFLCQLAKPRSNNALVVTSIYTIWMLVSNPINGIRIHHANKSGKKSGTFCTVRN